MHLTFASVELMTTYSYCNPIQSHIFHPFSCIIRRFKQLSELMSEEDNWAMYRNDLDQQFTASTPCIPFLGVFLTQVVQQDSYNQCKPKRGCGIRKHSSALGNYTILEAITVRNQLEKLTYQHSVPRITGRGTGHRELKPKNETNDTASHCVHNHLQEVTQSSLTPAQSQSVQPSGKYLEGEREKVSLQNSERVSGPLQLSQSTMLAVSTRGTNRAKPCRVIREKSMSDPSLDVADLDKKFNEFADDMYVHSQSLECLQDNEPSSIHFSQSSSSSADSLDSLSSDEQLIPALKLPPSFDTTMSLPNGGPFSPSRASSVLSICNRKRRATTVVLRLNLAQMNCSTSPSDLLQKYQFFSLRCCRGVESRVKLRALLTDTAHNTEGQNYQLSYRREPQ